LFEKLHTYAVNQQAISPVAHIPHHLRGCISTNKKYKHSQFCF